MPITYNETGVTYDSTSYTWEGERSQPSVFPVAAIFVAWDDGPYVANPTWTEVTSDVRSFQTHRGRGSDFDQFDTGTAQITFDNRTRKYDPFYTSGTYYGKLLPRRQVKIVAQIGGVTYDVYRGFISGWPVTWSEYGKDSTVTVQCFDALGLMVNEQVPTDWHDYYIRQTGVRRFFRGNDSRTTTTIRDQYAENMSMSPLVGTPNFFERPTIALGLVGTSAAVINYYGEGQNTDSPQVLTLVAWAQRIPIGTFGLLLEYYTGSSGVGIEIYANGDYYAYGKYPAARQATGNIGFAPDTQPFHVAVATQNGTNVVVYINGQARTNTTNTSAGMLGTLTEQARANNVNFQDFAILPAFLLTADIAFLYNVSSGRISETTTARMNRIFGTTSWPAALTSLPASPAGTVGEIGSGTGVIQELQLVADSEGGELYVTKTGVLTMTARRDVFNAPRSANVQATITDSGAGIRYGSEIEIAYDADNLKNDITVNWSGDGEVVETNTVTIAAYGAAATVVETQLDSPTSAIDLATLELGVQGVLVPQLSTIDVSPNTAAADWQAILALELLDRVNFKRTPTVGNQFSRDALINAIDHQVEPGQWRTQVTLSMRYTSPLKCDDPVLGKVDYNYCG